MRISPVNLYDKYNVQNVSLRQTPNAPAQSCNRASSLEVLSNYNFAFNGNAGRKKNPVYVVNKDGSYEKYDSKKDAAEKLDLQPSVLCKYFMPNGRVAIPADEFEMVTKDGSTVVNGKVLKKCVEDANYYSLYLVNKDGSYKKYSSQTEAADDVGVVPSTIYNCTNKTGNTVKGKAAIRANDLEVVGEDGSITIDKKALKNCIQTANSSSIYLINKDGSYKKYPSQIEAVKELGVKHDSISRVLMEYNKTVKGKTAAWANDVEIIVDDCSIKVDEEKIKKLASEKIGR